MSNWTIAHLRVFITVAEEGSFHRAAARCFVSQPTVGRHIRTLEALVGGRLFERTPSGASLTPRGLALIAAARELVKRADDSVTSIRRELAASAPIRLVHCPDSALTSLSSVLAAVGSLVERPQMRAHEDNAEAASAAVARGDADLALVVETTLPSGLVVQRVNRNPVVALVPLGQPDPERRPASATWEFVAPAPYQAPALAGALERWRQARHPGAIAGTLTTNSIDRTLVAPESATVICYASWVAGVPPKRRLVPLDAVAVRSTVLVARPSTPFAALAADIASRLDDSDER